MNTENNQRYKQTDRIIVDTFMELLRNKEFKKITINEICKLSKLNRTTFYLHFVDIYDLMEKAEMSISNQFISLFTNNKQSIGEGFLQLLRYIEENKDYYKGYLKNGIRSYFNIILPSEISHNMFCKYEEFGYANEDEIKYHEEFFKMGFSAIIRLWLEANCKETPQEIMDIIVREYSPNKKLFVYQKGETEKSV